MNPTNPPIMPTTDDPRAWAEYSRLFSRWAWELDRYVKTLPTSSSGGGGGVTTVTASSPLASSGGATPNISISAGSAASDILLWSGAAWTANARQTGINSLTDIAGSTSGDVFYYNGTNALFATKLTANVAPAQSWFYGGGENGSFDFDGTNTYATYASKSGNNYTLIRNIYASSITVQNGCRLIGGAFGVYCNGTIDTKTSGSVDCNGGDAALSAAGTGWTAFYYGATNLSLAGTAGTQTGAPSAPTGATLSPITGNSGSGGSSPSGAGAAGVARATGPTNTQGSDDLMSAMMGIFHLRTCTGAAFNGGWGGGGARGEVGTPGGGGGGGGGGMGVFAKSITGGGTISCNGGAGGTMASGTNVGGGGGGTGGLLIVVTSSLGSSVTVSANGGAGGTGRGSGGNGTAGAAGLYKIIYA